MKKFPKALADVQVLARVLEYLYAQAENANEEAQNYTKRMEEAEDGGRWYEDQVAEYTAKADAYIRLAEKLGK